MPPPAESPDARAAAAEAAVVKPDADADDPNVASPPGLASRMVAVQLLSVGADCLLKQAVLLRLATGGFGRAGEDLQAIGLIAFAAPIVLGSPTAGWLVDRFPKRAVLIAAKAAEVLIAALAAVAWSGSGVAADTALVGALVLMAWQTAVLTPAKYGLLADACRGEPLTRVNWAMQAAAYAATAVGSAGAGILMGLNSGRFAVGAAAVLAASLGLGAALSLPRTIPARRETATRPRPWDGWRAVRHDRLLRDVLVVYAGFWLFAGLVHPTANAIGLRERGWSEGATSLLAAASAAGVIVGCVAGVAGLGRVTTHVVPRAAWTLVAIQVAVAAPSVGLLAWGYTPAVVGFFAMGAASGRLVVPLHVLAQLRSPEADRGGVLAAMNQLNWVALVASGVAYQLAVLVLGRLGWPPSTLLAAAAVVAAVGVSRLRVTEERLLR